MEFGIALTEIAGALEFFRRGGVIAHLHVQLAEQSTGVGIVRINAHGVARLDQRGANIVVFDMLLCTLNVFSVGQIFAACRQRKRRSERRRADHSHGHIPFNIIRAPAAAKAAVLR